MSDSDDTIPSIPESFGAKGIRKCKENPFVPIGCLVTVAFLGAGFVAFQKGQKQRMQYMMRGRVFAQAFTLVVIGGSYYLGIYAKKNY